MKKILYLWVGGLCLCLLVGAVFLAGCRGKKADNTLTVWVMGEASEKLHKLVEIFEHENPDIHLNIQAIPWGQAHEKLMTAAAGENLPDVFQVGTTWMAQFSALDVFENLSPYMAKSNIVAENKFFKGSWATNVFHGEIQGVPWYADTRILFYRKDLVKEAGFDTFPDNWDDFQKLGRKLIKKNANGQTDRWGFDARSAGIFYFLSTLWQNDATLLDGLNQPRLDDKPALEAIEYYKRFFDDGISSVNAKFGTDLVKAFEAGNICVFMGGPWDVEEIQRYAPDVMAKTGVSVMPGKKRRTSFVGGSNIVIYKKSAKKAAAWKFLEFLSRPDTQLTWYQVAQALPSTLAAWQDKRFQDDPILSTFGEQMKDAQSPPTIYQWEEISNEVLNLLELLVNKKITVKDFADQADQKIIKIIERK